MSLSYDRDEDPCTVLQKLLIEERNLVPERVLLVQPNRLKTFTRDLTYTMTDKRMGFTFQVKQGTLMLIRNAFRTNRKDPVFIGYTSSQRIRDENVKTLDAISKEIAQKGYFLGTIGKTFDPDVDRFPEYYNITVTPRIKDLEAEDLLIEAIILKSCPCIFCQQGKLPLNTQIPDCKSQTE